jgi:hypothetical protein
VQGENLADLLGEVGDPGGGRAGQERRRDIALGKELLRSATGSDGSVRRDWPTRDRDLTMNPAMRYGRSRWSAYGKR